jgi:hypothetical protein
MPEHSDGRRVCVQNRISYAIEVKEIPLQGEIIGWGMMVMDTHGQAIPTEGYSLDFLCISSFFNSFRIILPVAVMGSSPTNSISLGYS